MTILSLIDDWIKPRAHWNNYKRSDIWFCDKQSFQELIVALKAYQRDFLFWRQYVTVKFSQRVPGVGFNKQCYGNWTQTFSWTVGKEIPSRSYPKLKIIPIV